MRIGLYGGTFDPIHLGHLILAEACREACGLDRVWFVVAGAPPHKPGGRTDAGHRLEMVRLAVAGNPAFEVSEIETNRPGPHYSVETLEAVARERPDDELSFLIGADSLVDLPHWREPEAILRLAGLVVANRPGFEPPPIATPGDARPIRQVTIPPIGIASKEIRRALLEGRSIRYQVPRAVEAYIAAHGLYRPSADAVASGRAGG
jgi:nicotinate-nucleotide adenylyltransferase